MAEYAAACAAAYLIQRNEHKIYGEVYWNKRYLKKKNLYIKCEVIWKECKVRVTE
jgi:hypothetical protein